MSDTNNETDNEKLTLQMLSRSHYFIRWIIFLELAILIFLFFKFRLSTQIERDVLATKVKTDQIEKLTIDFMTRTVDRWDKLQKDNPDVKVPKVAEPLVKP